MQVDKIERESVCRENTAYIAEETLKLSCFHPTLITCKRSMLFVIVDAVAQWSHVVRVSTTISGSQAKGRCGDGRSLYGCILR